MNGPDSTRPLQGPQGRGEPVHDRIHDAGASDPTTFRRLLEQLEAVARPTDEHAGTPPGAPSDLHALQDALRDADRDYEQLMAMRRQLERAFRRSNDAVD